MFYASLIAVSDFSRPRKRKEMESHVDCLFMVVARICFQTIAQLVKLTCIKREKMILTVLIKHPVIVKIFCLNVGILYQYMLSLLHLTKICV